MTQAQKIKEDFKECESYKCENELLEDSVKEVQKGQGVITCP